MDKEFKSANQQMRLLRSRGLHVEGSYAKRIIERENYYNLINGYKNLFLDDTYTGPDEKYQQGADFKEVYALFIFDRELRSLFLRYILEIENNVRSILSRDFSEKYGHDNYLKYDNFTSDKQKLPEITALISSLSRDISVQTKKANPMITHYVLSYGYVPLWVLVNVISLGTLSKFYSLLKQHDQNDIGKYFSLTPKNMINYLKNLAIARNSCAHDERFFDINFRSAIPTIHIHSNLSIPVNTGGEHIMGKKDVFSLVIILKAFLPKKAFNKFFYLLKDRLEVLDGNLSTISIDKVKKQLGFPSNWQSIKNLP